MFSNLAKSPYFHLIGQKNTLVANELTEITITLFLP